MKRRRKPRIWVDLLLAIACASCQVFLGGCQPTSSPTTSLSPAPTLSAQPWTASPWEVNHLQSEVTYLASDPLEGRGVGTRGLDLAAAFLEQHDRSLGLRPLPALGGYFQPFTYTLSTTVGAGTGLSINGVALERGRDFNPLPISASGDFAGPVVFAGYGVTDPSHGYDDYTGIDAHGKVVLVMRYEPHNASGSSRFTNGPTWSASSGLMLKVENAARHGAVGLILVNPPTFHGVDLLLTPTMPHAPQGRLPAVQVKQAALAGYLDLAALQHQIDGDGKPHSIDLANITTSAHIELVRQQVVVKNVVACLPGFGPHADEYVVVGAHYDHLGHGGFGSLAFGSHAIHHGADDNASGTAAVMELAERLTRAGRLGRSVIFCNFTAEEEGLIGSTYFVNHPPVPLSKIVGMVNLDMVGRVRDDKLFIGGSGTCDAFESILSSADAGLPLRLKESGPYIGKGGYGPSDHMSFAQKGIPVLFFFSGMHSDYHTPTDTAEKVNYPGIDAVVTLAERVVDAMATMPIEPYIAKYDSMAAMGGASGDTGARRAALGVIPDYGTDDTTPGVKITGTRPGSAAAQAGLQDGDILVGIDQSRIDSLYDLEAFLEHAKSGDHVIVRYLRRHRQLQAKAVLE